MIERKEHSIREAVYAASSRGLLMEEEEHGLIMESECAANQSGSSFPLDGSTDRPETHESDTSECCDVSECGPPVPKTSRELGAFWASLLHFVGVVRSLPAFLDIWKRILEVTELNPNNGTARYDSGRLLRTRKCHLEQRTLEKPRPETVCSHVAWRPLRRYRKWLSSHAPSVPHHIARLSSLIRAERGSQADLYSHVSDPTPARRSRMLSPDPVCEGCSRWLRTRSWIEGSLLSSPPPCAPSRISNTNEDTSRGPHHVNDTQASFMRKRWRLMLNVFTASASAGCSSQAASRLTSSERQFPNDRYESFSDEAILRTDEDSKIPTPCRCSTDTSAMLCVTSRSENRLQSSRSRDTAREKTPVVAVDCLNGTCCSEATASTDKLVSVSPMQLEERSRSTWVLGWQVRLPWPQRLRIRDEPSARIRASENESHTTGANESAHGMETWRIFHSFSRDLISLSSWLTIRRLSSGFHEWSSDDEPPLDPYAPLIISAARPDDPESSEQVQSVSHEMSLFSDNQNSRWRGHLQSTSADNGELGLTASAVQTTQSLPSTVSGVPDDEYTTSTANSVRTPFMISGRLQERLQRLTLNLHIFSGDSNPSFVRHDQLANMGSSSFEDLSILDHTQRYHSDSTGVLEDRGFDSETIDKYTRLGHVQWNCRPTDQVPSTLSREEDKVSSSGYQRLDGSQEARSRRSTSELSTFQPPADRCVICLEPMLYEDIIRILPCLHFYHKDCVDRWLHRQRRCPICNGNVEELAQAALTRHNSEHEDALRARRDTNQLTVTYPESMLSRAIHVRRIHRRAPSPALLFPNEDPVELIESEHGWRDWFEGPVLHEL